MIRLHIVGCPRSGTTLLMELMSTCFASDDFCAHEMSIFEPAPVGKSLYFSKQPNDIKLISHIFHHDENLFVIYLGRDPRAVISSTHRENPHRYFCNYRVWSESDRSAQGYLGHRRFLNLRYEDLVANPNAIQARIAQQFDFLKQLHCFSEYEQHATPSAASASAMSGLRQVDADSLEKWRKHLPRIAEQLKRRPEMLEDLQRLGYEVDNRWSAVLRGVEPVVYPCRYAEQRPQLKEWEKAARVWFKSRRYLRALSP